MSFGVSVESLGAVTVRADVDPTELTFEQAAVDLDIAIEQTLASYRAQRQVADSWRHVNGPTQPAPVLPNPTTTNPKEGSR